MINFTGDVSITDGYFNAGFGIGSEIMKGKNPFSGIQKGENDIWVGNFEGVAHATKGMQARSLEYLLMHCRICHYLICMVLLITMPCNMVKMLIGKR